MYQAVMKIGQETFQKKNEGQSISEYDENDVQMPLP